MIHEIAGKLEMEWNEEVKAIIDTWTDYDITLAEFKEAILGIGLDYAKANGAIAWIVDSSRATGGFSQTIQDFIRNYVFHRFATIGIKYFITITSKKSAVTRMTVISYSSKIGPHGIRLLEVNSIEEAIEWLKIQN